MVFLSFRHSLLSYLILSSSLSCLSAISSNVEHKLVFVGDPEMILPQINLETRVAECSGKRGGGRGFPRDGWIGTGISKPGSDWGQTFQTPVGQFIGHKIVCEPGSTDLRTRQTLETLYNWQTCPFFLEYWANCKLNETIVNKKLNEKIVEKIVVKKLN